MFCNIPPSLVDDTLRQELPKYRPPEFSKLTIHDRYLATSLLQKAIRRNELDSALSAGEFLRCNYPSYFWRRLPIIALEDVGLANQALVYFVMVVTANPPVWGVVHGMAKVAHFIIEKLCKSPKDRAADDLFDVVSRDPVCANNCIELANSAEIDVVDIEPDDDVFARVFSLIPPRQQNGEFKERLSRPDEWAWKIEQAEFVISCSTTIVASLAAKQTRSVLAPMLAALDPEFPKSFDEVHDDLMPAAWHGGVPTWACGQHTRVGLAGLRAYAKRSKRAATLLQNGKTGDVSTSKVLGGLLFRFECGQLRHRADWSVGSDLKRRATLLGWGLKDDYVPDLLNTMIDEWELLNECRLACLENHLR